MERVAEANAEAIASLPTGGIAVVPADAAELEPHLGRTDIEIVRFDRSAVVGSGHTWTFSVGDREISLTLPFTARHMAENALAALVTYDALGLPLDRAQAGADAIRAFPVAWGGDDAQRGRHRRQRLLQREPRLDEGGSPRPRRACRELAGG